MAHALGQKQNLEKTDSYGYSPYQLRADPV